MGKEKLSTYEVLVYVAYGYYILLGLIWFIMSLGWGGYFNSWAFMILVMMGVQVYYRHLLTNLILGIIAFGLSIFWSLQFTWLGQQTTFDLFTNTMLGVSITSLIMSAILISSYLKLSFKNK